MRTEAEILQEIREVVRKDFEESEMGYLSWVDMITSDPPDRLSELFSEADIHGQEFCSKVYHTVRLAIKGMNAN